MFLNLETWGETEVSRELMRIKYAGEDMRPAFLKIRESFVGAERYQFSSQGGYLGGWKPLAPVTVERKAAQGLDPRILHATLRLRNSLTTFDGPDVLFEMTGDELKMGSRVPYGAFHQSRATRSRLPRRPPVVLPEALKRRWMRYLQTYLLGGGAVTQ